MLLPAALDADFVPDFIAAEQATRLYETLVNSLPWQQQPIKIFGKEFMQPRLISWHGDAGAVYTYSKQRQVPQAWTPALQDLRLRLQDFAAARFNSVLANYYRHGQDSMGWHSDNEPELGPEPVIASLSFGAARAMQFRPVGTSRVAHEITLTHGSLLLMRGRCQQNWQHAIPKRQGVASGRINLTFRWVMPVAV